MVAATPVGGGRIFALPAGGGFPEGIAYDEATGDFYVGSLIDGTIYRGNVETGTVEVFLPGQPGRVAVGLALDDRGRLFVAGGQTGAIAVYDTVTRQLLLEAATDWPPIPSSTTSTSARPATPTSPTRSTRCSIISLPRRSPPVWERQLPYRQRTRSRLSSTSRRPGSISRSPGSMPTASSPRLTDGISSWCRPIPAVSSGSTRRRARRSRSIWAGRVCRRGWYRAGRTDALRRARGAGHGSSRSSADFASGRVGASFSDPSFAAPTTLERFDGCLLVVNSQVDALQGQPQLPFTVSCVPIPGQSAEAATATPVATTRC